MGGNINITRNSVKERRAVPMKYFIAALIYFSMWNSVVATIIPYVIKCGSDITKKMSTLTRKQASDLKSLAAGFRRRRQVEQV